jgi:hypothetical protein
MNTKILGILLVIFLAPFFIFANQSYALSFCVNVKKGKIAEGSNIKLRAHCLKNETTLPVALISDIPVISSVPPADDDSNENIELNKTVKIGINKTESIGSSLTETVGSARDITVGANDSLTVGGQRSETVGANKTELIGGSRDTTIGGNDTLTIGQAYDFTCGAGKTESIGGAYELSVGGSTSINTAADTNVIAGKKILLSNSKALISLDQFGDVQITGRNITIKASGDLTLKGSRIIN